MSDSSQVMEYHQLDIAIQMEASKSLQDMLGKDEDGNIIPLSESPDNYVFASDFLWNPDGSIFARKAHNSIRVV